MKKFLIFSWLVFWGIYSYATQTPVSNSTYVTAMSSAIDGDTLLLAPGLYGSNISFQSGKTITLKSAGGGSVILNFQVGGTATDVDCGLIFDGVVINRSYGGTVNNYFVDGSTFGNVKLLAFRNDTIKGIGRCLVRGSNTTITNMTSIEISNCFITQNGANGYCFLYPKFYVQNVTVKNNTIAKNYNSESFYKPQSTLSTNVLTFVFENNTVFGWSKSNSYALCYSGTINSTASSFTFRNNIITKRATGGTSNPNILLATGGTLLAEKNLIVDFGSYSQTTAVSSTINDLSLAGLSLSAIGFTDTSANDFTIVSSSPIATASTTGGIIGAPRWLKVLNTARTITTSVSPVGAGITSPSNAIFNDGDSVSVSATKAFGYQFSEWRDANGNTVSTKNPYKFKATADLSLTAIFTSLVTYDFTLNKLGEGGSWGRILVSPAATNGKYEAGTVVTITVVPNLVTSFLYWDDLSSSLSRSITIDDNKTLTATFDVVPFIVGWDFYSTTPVTNRAADYAFTTDNTGLLSNYEATGVSTTWGASTKTFGSETYNSARRYTDYAKITLAARYLQARFSGVGYDKITVTAKAAIDNSCVLKRQFMQYSIDGTNFSNLDTIDFATTPSTSWVSFSAVLPQLTEASKTTIYIRWASDISSDLVGTPGSTDTEGFYLTNIIVYAEALVVDDQTPPTLVSSNPAENSSNASAVGNIVLTFNERMQAGSGSICFNNKTVTPTIGNKTVSFSYSNLQYGSSYTLTIASGTLTDMAGNPFAGTTINFSTMVRPHPSARLYDAVVALDGSGDYKTIQAAIDAAPSGRTSPWLIFIKNGTYYEYVRNTKPYIYLIGQDKNKTILTFHIACVDDVTSSDYQYSRATYGLSDCALMVYNASDMYAENISFINAFGVDFQKGPMALALRSQGDRCALHNCKLRSYQDTWYTTTSGVNDRTYISDSWIEGAVDYLYGGGNFYGENCTFYNVRSGAVVIAPSTNASTQWGYVLNNCTIDGNSSANDGTLKLGRPWQNAPQVYWLNTTMNVLPAAEGWTDMGVLPKRFAEYNSMDKNGNPIDLSSRRTYFKPSGGVNTEGNKPILTAAEAAAFTYENVLTVDDDTWNPRALFEPVAQPTISLNHRTLSWSSAEYAICYVIERDSVAIGFTKETSFADLTATEGIQNTYTVRAVNEYGSLSTYSNAVVSEGKKLTLINWSTPASITSGTALSSTQLNAVAVGNTSTPVYTPSIGTILTSGTNTLTVYFAADNNYAAATKTVSLVVTTASVVKKTTSINWGTPSTITYGTALSSTELNATIIGSSGTISYSPASGTILSAGTHYLTVTVAADDNYEAASKTVSIIVNKAASSIAWTIPDAITYGTALGSSQLNAIINGSTGAVVYNPVSGTVLNAGNRTINVTALADANYEAASKTISILVNKAASSIAWANPAAIHYGTYLSDSQLNAIVTGTTGALVYNPVSGTLLDAGNRTITVIASADENYEAVSKSVSIWVKKAASTIVWPNPVSISYGTALGAEQLNAIISGTNGSVTYSPISGTVIDAGTHVITVSAEANTNYDAISKTVTILVNKAASSITWNSPPAIIYGTALSISQLSAQVAGTNSPIEYNPAKDIILSVGIHSITATAAANSNYDAVSKSVNLEVNKAELSVVAKDTVLMKGVSVLPDFKYLITGFVNGDQISVVSGAASATVLIPSTTKVGDSYDIIVDVSGLTAANYSFASGATNGKLTIIENTSTNSIKLKDVSIYPNPLVDDILTIVVPSFKVGSKLSVISLTGEVVLFKKLEGKNTELNTTTLQPGTYFIQITTPDGVVTKQISKL